MSTKDNLGHKSWKGLKQICSEDSNERSFFIIVVVCVCVC